MTSEAPLVLLNSRFEDIVWPALPHPDKALDLALLYQLEQSQWQPAEDVRRLQMLQTSKVLQHAAKTVPIYRDRLMGSHRPRDLLEGQWQQIPLLTRSDVQSAGNALYSKRVPAGHGKIQEIRTSGSTGRPIKVRGTALTRTMYRVFTQRENLWHKRDFAKTMAVIRVARGVSADPPDGTVVKGWDPHYGAGKLAMLTITATIDQQLRWLEKVNPAYLLSFPSNLEELARRSSEAGVALPNLEHARTVGELVTDKHRDAVRAAWNVDLVDMYTSQEAGYLALQCPDRHDVYHIQSENVLLEVLNDAGEACEEGETGKVVITTLYNFAAPLIRYEIGDYARVGGACSCGRTLPTLTAIQGRRRNMLTLPNGEKRWPFFGENLYRHVAPIRQYQLIQKSLTKVEVKLVVARPLAAEEERKLTGIVQKELGYPFDLDFLYVDEIPRGAGGKYEDFRSELLG